MNDHDKKIESCAKMLSLIIFLASATYLGHRFGYGRETLAGCLCVLFGTNFINLSCKN